MCDVMVQIDIGEMPTDSWWKLITPKEIIAGMNQLKGRNILILDLVSSDMEFF